MPDQLPSGPRKRVAPALEERRDQVIATLAAHFAADRLSMDQLEQRMDLAQRAAAADELDALLADLPDTQEPAARPAPARLADPDSVRSHQVLAAVMGGVERKGHWVPARKTLVFTFMGGAEIDLREASFPPGDVEIAIFAVWGGAEIIVPPEVRVDMGGVAIMGGFTQDRGNAQDPGPGAPCIRITGFALMGGVEVMVRYPGETARDAKRRIREERKRLQKGQREKGQ
jgi:hypothetical protein